MRNIKNGKSIDEDDYQPLISEEPLDFDPVEGDSEIISPSNEKSTYTTSNYIPHIATFKKNGVSIITPPTISLKRKSTQKHVSSSMHSEAKFGFDIEEKTLDELIALKNVLSVKIAEKEALLK